MARKKKPGIFCLEGDWDKNLKDKTSVRPLLEFLDQNEHIDFIYRDVGTPNELVFYVKKWQQSRYSSYNIGYFAFHGEPDAIFIGRNKKSIEELGKLLEGACSKKTLYFGSCKTLNIGRKKILELKKITKARCVCGYTKDVNWFPCSAFELLLFYALTNYKRIDLVDKYLKKYSGLVRELGFKIYW